MRTCVIALGLAAGILAAAGTPPAARAAGGGVPPPAGVVSPRPAGGTPHLAAAASHAEQIRQVVPCGGTMYAVGSFGSVISGGITYRRTGIFSFSASAPFRVTSWSPDVTGVLNSIAFAGGNCANAYIGGRFGSVNGVRVSNIAEISTGTGRVVPGFGHDANGTVSTLLAVGRHLLAGGTFTRINGSASPYFASLNPRTGRGDGFASLRIHGNYQFPGVSPNGTQVYNTQLSHSGRLALVEGDFTSAGGLPRRQIFMLAVSGAKAAVTRWTSPEFNQDCWATEPFYVRAAGWSPDDATVYLATTGYRPHNLPGGSFPRSGLCDAAAAFPATQAPVRHKWINYTGCDSLYSVAADRKAVYFGGHQRWSMNRLGCDFPGPGALSAPGLTGVDPATGRLYVNPAGTAGYYSRSRGLGADDILVTRAGLWIASDNFAGSDTCGGVSGLAGLCFLPY